MAKIVMAAGMSHGPMLALEPEMWFARARDEMDSKEPHINKPDGSFVTYTQFHTEVGDKYNDQATLENFTVQHSICQAALDRLADDLEASRPDIVLIIGNDQKELFNGANSPALAIYQGNELATYRRKPDGMPAWRVAVSKAYGMDRVRRYPGSPEAATQVTASLLQLQFDVSACDSIPDPEKQGFGHAYGFVVERIFRGAAWPILPVLINTIFPPNVPTPARCHQLGLALKQSIADLSDDLRIAVIASGGLSHFICEEAFDLEVLDAIQRQDGAYLSSIPEEKLTSGSSETRSWIVLAGMLGGLDEQWTEYVPIRRTPPGTGQGMAFGVWGPSSRT